MAKPAQHHTELRRYYPPATSGLIRGRGPGNPVPPTPLFAVPFVALIWWHTKHPWPIESSGSLTLLLGIGWALVLAGMVLFTAALVTFARAHTGILLTQAATNVVNAGPYRWSRNPMYVSFVALYVGGCLAANTLWPLLALPVILLIVTRVVIAREEKYMLDAFETSYLKYVFDVPRWL